MDDVRHGKGADLLPHRLHELLLDGVREVVAAVQGHKGVDAAALDLMVDPACASQSASLTQAAAAAAPVPLEHAMQCDIVTYLEEWTLCIAVLHGCAVLCGNFDTYKN